MRATRLSHLLRTGLVFVPAVLATAIGMTDPAHSASRHRHHVLMQESAGSAPRAMPHDRSFYPEDIDGGVAGNLPFNNQIRKFKDPLNANGGR